MPGWRNTDTYTDSYSDSHSYSYSYGYGYGYGNATATNSDATPLWPEIYADSEASSHAAAETVVSLEQFCRGS